MLGGGQFGAVLAFILPPFERNLFKSDYNLLENGGIFTDHY